MKNILLIISFFATISWGQNIHLITFIKEDTVQLRWFAAKPETMQAGLKNGYTVERSGNGKTESFVIAPLEERKSSLNLNDSITSDTYEFAVEFMQIADFNSTGAKTAFGLLSLSSSAYIQVANVLGCSFEDIGLSDGKYEYKVKVDNIISNAEQINTKKLSTNNEFTTLEGWSRPDLVQANLKWEAEVLNPHYGGYYIYKSTDKKVFTKLNALPLFHFTSDLEKDKSYIDYVDKAVEEGKTYFYQVQPINHFGDPGTKSEVVEVYIQKRLNGVCVIDTVFSNELNRNIVGFYKSDKKENVKSFSLFRSDSIAEGYELISKQAAGKENTFSFNYKAHLTSGDRHYFLVAAVGEDGDSLYSFPYYHFSLDQIPPGLPTDLKGEIDSAGIARITWNPPSDEDIQGYRVFRGNSLKEEFVEITENYALDEHFEDTLSLNNLTSEIYYKIRAVDMNYNNGPLTAPVKLLKPDTIPPVPPLLRKYEVKEEGVYLTWNNSPSEDVEYQYLLRQIEGYKDTISSISQQQNNFLDTTCLLGRNYIYSMVAVDASENTSVSKGLNVTYEIGWRPAPKGLKGEANRTDKTIVLGWNTIMDEIYSIQIYRAKNDGKFRLYKTIRENTDVFEDNDLSINNEYKYKIKVTYKSGISSKMSEEIRVMY